MGLHTVNRYFDLYDWEVILKCDFLVTKIYVKMLRDVAYYIRYNPQVY